MLALRITLMLLSPTQMLVVGSALVFLGFILPWLMLLRIVEATLFLSFVAYIAMVAGMVLGTVGAILKAGERHF